MIGLIKKKSDFDANQNKIDYATWTSISFSSSSKVDVVVNTINELLNLKVMGTRDKPIINTFEVIKRKFKSEF